MSKKLAEKNQEIVRKLSILPENKQCMDCVAKGTPYVVMDFGIFVCSFCSGIHRSFQFKAKGISMTNFKDSEVEILRNGGNARARKIWRAGWDPSRHPLPKAYDEKAVRAFIHKTYVEKAWKTSLPESEISHEEEQETPKVEPLQKIVPHPIPIEVRKKEASKKTLAPAPALQPPEEAFPDDDEEWPAETEMQKAQQKPSNNLDIFFESPQTNNNNQGDDFPAEFPEEKKSLSIDDLFGPSNTQQTVPGMQANNGFGAPSQAPFGGYPPQQQQPPFGGYPPQQPQYQQQHHHHHHHGYPPQGFPPSQGYPQQQHHNHHGFPPQAQGYPPAAHGYPTQGFPPGPASNTNPFATPHTGPSPFASHQPSVPQSNLGPNSFNNPFGGNHSSAGLSAPQHQVNNPSPPQPQKPDPFSGLGSLSSIRSNGNSAPKQSQQNQQNQNSNGLDFLF